MKSCKERHKGYFEVAIRAIRGVYFDQEVRRSVIKKSLKEIRDEIDEMLVTFEEVSAGQS